MNQYNPNIHHRRSIRLKGYDYSQAGLYFITICSKDRICCFGDVINGEMVLNDAGTIANKCWLQIPNHFPNSVLHEHIVMPNHVHGIIELKSDTVGAEKFLPDNVNVNDNYRANNDHIVNGNYRANNDNIVNGNYRANNDSPLRSPSKSIGSIIRGFKIGVTKWMRENTDLYVVWQRNYYERIIRNEQSYQTISEYIINNPAKWGNDKFYRQ